jgi:hypothetical protein
VTHEKKDRESLIRKARCGEISSDAAEAEAKRLGLGPLARKPKESDFDPMSEPRWTLVMAIAWIAWRRPRLVLYFWDKFRLEFWDWRSFLRHVEPEARTHYYLVQRRPATLGLLLRLEREEARAEEKVLKSEMSCQTANAKLWKALQAGEVQATGISLGTSQRVQIPSYEWEDLSNVEEKGRDLVWVQNASSPPFTRPRARGAAAKLIAQHLHGRDDVDAASPPVPHGYANVMVGRTEVMRIWPSLEPAPTAAAAAQLNSAESGPVKAVRRGATPKYDWAEVEILVFELMNEKGEFREWDVDSGWCTRADLERRALEHFEDQVTRNTLKRSPGESTVRGKVVLSLAKWRSTQEASKGQ